MAFGKICTLGFTQKCFYVRVTYPGLVTFVRSRQINENWEVWTREMTCYSLA